MASKLTIEGGIMKPENNTLKFNQQIEVICEKAKEKAGFELVRLRLKSVRNEVKALMGYCVLFDSHDHEHPEEYLDLAFCLLCYEPEFAIVLAADIKNLEYHKFKITFLNLLTALTHAVSYYRSFLDARDSVRGCISRIDDLNREKMLERLDVLCQNELVRAQAAADFLVFSLFSASRGFKDLKAIFHKSDIDPEIREQMILKIRDIAGPELTEELIRF